MLEERMCDTSMLEERAVVRFLNRFAGCPFLVEWKDHEDRVGHDNPMFAVDIRETIPVKGLTDSTSLALGEVHMKDKLEVKGSLYETLDHFLGQMDRFSVNRLHLRKLLYPSNLRRNQKIEVSSYYDIGNDFYKLWLNETMNYSCGYFKSEKDTLYEAQMNKTDYVLKKLALKGGMGLLDVGRGWGFLLIRTTREYGIKGTGIALSTEQHDDSKECIEEEGLRHFLDVQLVDCRDLPKGGMKFDRVVSMGMMEHVGRENYGRFVDCMDKVLNPSSVFLLHFTSSRKEHAGDPWIKKYMFPGGVIPSLREIISLMAEHGFHILDVENLGNHYSKTLLCWGKNFKGHEKEVKDMLNEEFVRMWDLYLYLYTVAFRNGVIDLHQILVSKGMNNELPMVRWY